MSRTPAPSEIAGMILTAPAWTRLGLGVRDPRARTRAATEIACRIVNGLADRPEDDPRQLMLPIPAPCASAARR